MIDVCLCGFPVCKVDFLGQPVWVLCGNLTEDKSATMHNEGEGRMLQLKIEERFCFTFNKKVLFG